MTSSSSPGLKRILNYGGAMAGAAVALLLRITLEHATGGALPTYVLFYPAILVTALVSGLGPGLLATASAALLADYFVLAPHGFGISHPADIVSQLIFCSMGLLLSIVSERYRKLRFRLEEAVAERTAEMQTIFDTLPVGISIANDPQGLHIRGNQVTERIFGLPAGAELSFRSNRQPYRVMQDGRELSVDELPMQRAVRGENISGLRLKIVRDCGLPLFVHCSAVPLLDEQGRSRGAIGSFLDISDLKRSEERLNLLAETAGILLVSESPQTMIEVLCGKAMEVLDCQTFFNFLAVPELGRLQLNACAGIPEQEQRKIEWLDYGVAVCGCAARDACRIVIDDIPDSDDPRVALIRPYGILTYACHPLVSGGEVLGTLSFGRRIAGRFSDDDLALMKAVSDLVAIALERKRSLEKLQTAHDQLEVQVAERTVDLMNMIDTLQVEMAQRTRTMKELSEKDRLLIQQTRLAAMGEMIGNIAHQWRQPLNTLGLLIQQTKQFHAVGRLDGDCLNTLVLKCMELIRHMSQTIDDFRFFFSPDKETVAFSVPTAVSSAISLVRDSFINQGIRLESDLDGDCLVNGHPNEYAQSVLNLLINAKDVLVERGVADPCVTVRARHDGKRSIVTIADNAGGVPEEIIDRIFEPYFSTKGPQQGTGVGLFMSRTIIEKNMGGTLTVRNNEQGAEFRIEV